MKAEQMSSDGENNRKFKICSDENNDHGTNSSLKFKK